MSQKNDWTQTELDGLTLSQEDSPVRTCQLPEIKQESKRHAPAYGENCAELLATYDQDTQSWRTSQLSLVEATGGGLERFLETWSRSGMTVNGTAYRLPNLARTITEIGSGLFATPNTLDGMPPKSEKAIKKEMEVTRKGRSQPANLRDQVTQAMWPTATTQGWRSQGSIKQMKALVGVGKTTVEEAEQMMGGSLNPKRMEYWPTPSASDNRDRGNLSNPCLQRRLKIGKQLMLSQVVSLESGKLNPNWVEWLMGFPEGWTDLKDSETQ